MVLCPENDRRHRTISIAEEFTLRRFPISGAPVDPRTAAGLRILGPADANSTAGASGQASLCGSRETTGPRSWPQPKILSDTKS